ncbi:MAG: FAD-binding oxidoreductase, partial [Candidatus Aenigmarchaeota archaeon]|nr:FAD-binding oxidoreductase [Candidatus Aenigmarchaeota archaeon]
GGSERKAASWGNAGFISPAFGPLSPTKASFSKLLHWMEPSSVVKVRTGFFLRETGWLLSYLRKSSAISGKPEMSLMREMSLYGLEWYSMFSENHDINMRKDGLLEPYFGKEKFDQRVAEINGYGSGIPFEVLGKQEVAKREPMLNECSGGIFYPEESVLEPAKLLREARGEAENNGVHFAKNDVENVNIINGLVKSVESQGTHEFDLYIMSKRYLAP